jgi:hypothetical protein
VITAAIFSTLGVSNSAQSAEGCTARRWGTPRRRVRERRGERPLARLGAPVATQSSSAPPKVFVRARGCSDRASAGGLLSPSHFDLDKIRV